MYSHRAHPKRRNPSLASPHGQPDSDQHTAVLGFGWGTLEPYSLRLPGSGAEAEWAEAVQVMVGPLACPPPPLPVALRASGHCGRPDLLPGFPRTWSCWSWAIRFMVAPQAWLGVDWGAPSHSPTALMGGETAFIFLPPRLQRGFCSKWNNAYPGRKHCGSSKGQIVSPSCPLPRLVAMALPPWGCALRAHPWAWHSGAVGPRGQPSTEARRWVSGRPRCAGSSAVSNWPR